MTRAERMAAALAKVNAAADQAAAALLTLERELIALEDRGERREQRRQATRQQHEQRLPAR